MMCLAGMAGSFAGTPSVKTYRFCQLPLGGSLWRARKLCTLAGNFAAPEATPSVIACGDATFPKGTASAVAAKFPA